MRYLAAVAAIAALPAAAWSGELETGVGGFINAGGGVADPAGTHAQFGLFRDAEVHFRVKGVMDNGLTVRARVELEGFSAFDQIDENWVSVSGAFGGILIGGADTALNEQGGVGVVYPSGPYFNYYDGTGRITPGDPGPMVGKNDSIGVRYWVNLAGIEVGASYQPSATADGPLDSNNFIFPTNDQYAVGANYSGDIGGVGFALGGGYLWSDDTELAHAGVELSHDGFTVAGFYDRDERDGVIGAITAERLDRFGLGGMYESGPWSVGGGYTLTDRKNGRADSDFVHVGAGYDVIPGVTAYGAAQWGENEQDVDGYGVFSWVNLRF